MNAIFEAKAPKVMTWFMHDFGLLSYQAAGIVGNFGRESEGFVVLREIGAAPGEGGYGWGQWTGPRSHLFLNWCHLHALDWHSDEGNYGYAKHELETVYAYVIQHLKATRNLEAATVMFEKYYERAGVPALADRISWAREAERLYLASLKGNHNA